MECWESQRNPQASLKCSIFYATSDNKWKIFDINRAKQVLGYAPEDGAGGEYVEAPPPPRDR